MQVKKKIKITLFRQIIYVFVRNKINVLIKIVLFVAIKYIIVLIYWLYI